jgi:hypothetical protein
MGWLATAGLAIAVTVAGPCLALNGPFHSAWQRPQGRAYQAQHPPPGRPYQGPARAPQGARPQMSRPPARPQSGGHAGDWLRHYKDMPPAEQERALQNDPAFRRLPPGQQQQLRQRLQHFSALPPPQQLRMLNRMETWEHLTPGQKDQARQIFGQIRALPPGRQRAVGTAIHDLRGMPPEQREQIIDSERFKGIFSDQEREMMRRATRLPLAPAEEAGPQE